MTAALKPGHQLAALRDLHRSPRNPRTITDASLAQLKHTLRGRPALLRARPFITQLDGEVLAGNMRWLALDEMTRAGELGPIADEYPDGRYPVFAGSYDEAARREVMLLDNQSFGSWEDEALAALVNEHKEAGADMAMLGFHDAELASLLRAAGDPGGTTGRRLGDPSADPPPLPAEPTSKLGDLWLLGEHRLYVGDSSSDEAIAALFTDVAEADLIITDPPYGVSYQGRSIYGTAPGENATAEDWSRYFAYRKERASLMKRRSDSMEVANDNLTGEDLAALIACALGLAPLKAGGCFYVFSSGGAAMPVFFDGCIAADLPPRHTLVWVKDRFALGLQDYHYQHEPILYGWKGGASHLKLEDRTQSTVWEYESPKASKLHPTMKPVEMIRRMIRNSSRRNEVVYDPFGGSGSTLIAAHAEQRRCRICELDPAYADVIIARYEEYTDTKAQRVAVESESPTA